MHIPIPFSGGRRENPLQCFLLLLRHCNLNTNLKYMTLNSGPQSKNMAKNIRGQETVFLKSKILRRRRRNGVFPPSLKGRNGVFPPSWGGRDDVPIPSWRATVNCLCCSTYNQVLWMLITRNIKK